MNITDGKRETGIPSGPMVAWEDWHSWDRNQRRRVYDRLRKRSYRRFMKWRIRYITESMDHTYHLITRKEVWTHADHEAYVKGLRDALNELPYG